MFDGTIRIGSQVFWVGLLQDHRGQPPPVGRQRGGDRARRALAAAEAAEAGDHLGLGRGDHHAGDPHHLRGRAAQLPWLKLVGSLLLFWIGVKLLVPEDGDEDIPASDNLLAAIKTILIADLVMSLDNVIAVRRGGRAAAMTAAGPRPRDLDPAGDLRRHADAQADGALPGDHHHRRRPDRLGRRRDAGHRPGADGLAHRPGREFESGKPYVGGWNLESSCGAVGVVVRGRRSARWLAKRTRPRSAGRAKRQPNS